MKPLTDLIVGYSTQRLDKILTHSFSPSIEDTILSRYDVGMQEEKVLHELYYMMEDHFVLQKRKLSSLRSK